MKNLSENNIYKFGIEGFFNTYLSTFQVILGADLEAYSKQNDQCFNKENPCNIYFILKRPKVSINPKSFKSKGDIAFFDLIIHEKSGPITANIELKLKDVKSKLKLKCSYPYNIFSIFDKDGILLTARPGTLIDHVNDIEDIKNDKLDFEVLYIGQAYGKNGKRTALDRLMSHETLQKIYTHALTENPESDIWILLTNFSVMSSLFCIGHGEIIQDLKGEKRDEDLINHFLDNKGLKLSERQIINLTEAALIKYFEPKYNVDFKNYFPYSKHKSYSEYYDLDVRAINIELDTTELNRKLFTENTGRLTNHTAMYELKNDNDRLSLIKHIPVITENI